MIIISGHIFPDNSYLTGMGQDVKWTPLSRQILGSKVWVDLCQGHGHVKFVAMSNTWNPFHPWGWGELSLSCGRSVKAPGSAPVLLTVAISLGGLRRISSFFSPVGLGLLASFGHCPNDAKSVVLRPYGYPIGLTPNI